MDKKKELKKLGRNIAKIRTEKGFSQDALALESEVGRRTVNRIEVGETGISLASTAIIESSGFPLS